MDAARRSRRCAEASGRTASAIRFRPIRRWTIGWTSTPSPARRPVRGATAASASRARRGIRIWTSPCRSDSRLAVRATRSCARRPSTCSTGRTSARPRATSTRRTPSVRSRRRSARRPSARRGPESSCSSFSSRDAIMMMRRISVFLMFGLLLAGNASAQLASQTALVGTVTDQDGLVIPGAQVVAVNTGTRDTYETTTNGDGYYNIQFVRTGTYEITVALSGFQTSKVNGDEVANNQIARTNVVVRVGQLNESITVAGSAPILDIDSARMSEAIGKRGVAELALNRRTVWNPAAAQSVRLRDGRARRAAETLRRQKQDVHHGGLRRHSRQHAADADRHRSDGADAAGQFLGDHRHDPQSLHARALSRQHHPSVAALANRAESARLLPDAQSSGHCLEPAGAYSQHRGRGSVHRSRRSESRQQSPTFRTLQLA